MNTKLYQPTRKSFSYANAYLTRQWRYERCKSLS
ncbi:MAG: hypothetical protein KatS3mg015_2093 [Fimbriimonadales bacterium]|nr:MAG: hypothetical protein KatS3mg015_2093 [Fimbriimonadales bacterium]